MSIAQRVASAATGVMDPIRLPPDPFAILDQGVRRVRAERRVLRRRRLARGHGRRRASADSAHKLAGECARQRPAHLCRAPRLHYLRADVSAGRSPVTRRTCGGTGRCRRRPGSASSRRWTLAPATTSASMSPTCMPSSSRAAGGAVQPRAGDAARARARSDRARRVTTRRRIYAPICCATCPRGFRATPRQLPVRERSRRRSRARAGGPGRGLRVLRLGFRVPGAVARPRSGAAGATQLRRARRALRRVTVRPPRHNQAMLGSSPPSSAVTLAAPNWLNAQTKSEPLPWPSTPPPLSHRGLLRRSPRDNLANQRGRPGCPGVAAHGPRATRRRTAAARPRRRRGRVRVVRYRNPSFASPVRRRRRRPAAHARPPRRLASAAAAPHPRLDRARHRR